MVWCSPNQTMKLIFKKRASHTSRKNKVQVRHISMQNYEKLRGKARQKIIISLMKKLMCITDYNGPHLSSASKSIFWKCILKSGYIGNWGHWFQIWGQIWLLRMFWGCSDLRGCQKRADHISKMTVVLLQIVTFWEQYQKQYTHIQRLLQYILLPRKCWESSQLVDGMITFDEGFGFTCAVSQCCHLAS